MKFPILIKAEPIKSDISPIMSRGSYDVYVGAIADDRLPMYVVINRDYGVVEFTNEVFAVINDWLNFFVKNQLAANDDTFEDQLDLGLTN